MTAHDAVLAPGCLHLDTDWGCPMPFAELHHFVFTDRTAQIESEVRATTAWQQGRIHVTYVSKHCLPSMLDMCTHSYQSSGFRTKSSSFSITHALIHEYEHSLTCLLVPHLLAVSLTHLPPDRPRAAEGARRVALGFDEASSHVLRKTERVDGDGLCIRCDAPHPP